MKAMYIAFAAIVLIAFGANFGLNNIGFSSAERQASDTTRLPSDTGDGEAAIDE
ncbi:hypothetical protein [Tranquillimonas rosea]|uniref:hypothetical protein n=1 Tax=Tranquillimonas rosea TaxID=641238 RepID=UPI003BA98A15